MTFLSYYCGENPFNFLPLIFNLSFFKSQPSMTKQPTFTRRPRNEVWEKSAEIPYWWRVTTQIWVVTFHQGGISVLVSQTSFRGRRVKCRLFSQAKKKRGPNLLHLRPGLHAAATKSDFFVCVVKNRVWRFFAFNSCDFSQFFVMLIITEVQSELAIITKFAKIAKNRKSDDFLCYLPFCTVLCHVNNH